jgi:uncharacterized protein
MCGMRIVLVSLPDAARALMIGLARIPETGLHLDVQVSPQSLQLPQEEDAVVTEPVRVQGTLTKMASQIYFHGTIRGVVTVPCSRCLESIRSGFVAETRGVFLPASSVAEDEGGLTDEPDVYQHDGMSLDLRPLVREQIVLSFPVQQLCREECAGLCQVCGSNWNVEVCSCQTAEGDPRFAVLQRLRSSASSS